MHVRTVYRPYAQSPGLDSTSQQRPGSYHCDLSQCRAKRRSFLHLRFYHRLHRKCVSLESSGSTSLARTNASSLPLSCPVILLKSTSLIHFSRVEICKEPGTQGRCTGLLFHYHDGSREVLGQYCWNRFEFYDIRGSTTVSFHWAKDDGVYYLRDISFGQSKHQTRSGTHARLNSWPLVGQMSWWYNTREDYICLNGQDVLGIEDESQTSS